MTGPYGAYGRRYHDAGWSPLPLPPRRKKEPPAGYTGGGAPMATADQVGEWAQSRPAGNIALRLPPGVIGIDADTYKSDAAAADWARLIDKLGPLPDGPWSTSRDDGTSGIRLFKVPAGYVPRDMGDAGEVIHHSWRYVVAPPSIHEDTGQRYRWVGHDDGWIPSVRWLPELPQSWLDHLQAGSNGQAASADSGFQQPYQGGTSWTNPDLGELLRNGIPHGAAQDTILRDIVWKLVTTGLGERDTRGIWQAVVGKTAQTKPQPWTEADFRRHYDGATRKAPQDTAPAGEPGGALEMSEFLAQDEPEHDWAVPGLIERGDRIILTGPEGGGKSTLQRQLGVQLASGIHPFGGAGFPPVRVLLIDLENSAAQIRRKLKPLSLSADGSYKPVPGFHIQPRPQGIDLLNLADVAWLRTEVEQVRPALLIIGPIYKMHLGSATDEEPARRVSAVLDQIRADFGAALLMEAHTPLASGNGSRPIRPYGASLWLRWPEFGIHLSAEGAIRHWRGQRDERDWPAGLKRGGEWPWTISKRGRDNLWARITELCTEAGGQLSQRDLARLCDASQAGISRAIGEHAAEWAALAGDPP